MKEESHVKQEQLVEAALRRFSHFGVAKTTLTEIADDLSISKQTLFYYFPDKQSLVNAVIDKLSEEYYDELEHEISQAESVEDALLQITEVKSHFLEKYYMLMSSVDHRELFNTDYIKTRKKTHITAEIRIITRLLQQGSEKGELRALDASKTAILLSETLYAFSRCLKDHQGVFPEKAAFTKVLQSQQEAIKLFYQGLKKETWKA